MTDDQHRVVKSAVSARGAVLGRPILLLLVVSCALAIILLALVYWDFFGFQLGR